MDLGTLWVKIAGDARQLQQTLTATKNDMTMWGAGVAEAARGNEEALNSVGVAFAAVGAAASVAVGAGINAFSNFEKKMKDVEAISGNLSDDAFVKLADKAKEIGETTALSASQAAQGFYYLASAGLKAEEQLSAITSTTDLAIATQSELGRTTEIVVSAVSGFGLAFADTSRVTDVFAAAISNSQATMDKLGTSIPYVAASFNGLGYEVETAAAALAILYNNGLDASQAGTGLRRSMNRLIKPSKEAREAMSRLGISIADVNPETTSLVDIIGRFQQAMPKAIDYVTIFGERSEAMKILVKSGADALQDMTDKMNDAGGTAAEMRDKQMDSLNGSLTLLKSSLEGIAINFGSQLAPAIKSLAGNLQSLLRLLNDLPEPLKQAAAYATTLGGAAALLGGTFTLFVARLPKILDGFKALKGLSIAMSPNLVTLASNFGAVAVAAGAVAWSYSRISKAYKDYKEDTIQVNAANDVHREATMQLSQAIGFLREQMSLGTEEVHKNAIGFKGLKVEASLVQDGMVNVGDAFDYYNGMLHTGIEEARVAAEQMKKVNKAGSEQADIVEVIALKWEDAEKQIRAWSDITGAGYKASTEAQLEFVDSIIEGNELTEKAERGLANVRADLLADIIKKQKQAAKEQKRLDEQRQKSIDKQIRAELASMQLSSNGYKAKMQALRDLMDTEGISAQMTERLQQQRQVWYDDEKKRIAGVIKAEEEKSEKEKAATAKRLALMDKETKAKEEQKAKEKAADDAAHEAELQRDKEKKQKEQERRDEQRAAVVADQKRKREQLQEQIDAELKILDDYWNTRELSLDEQIAANKDYYKELYKLALKHGGDVQTVLEDYWAERAALIKEKQAQEYQAAIDHIDNIAGSLAKAFDMIRSQLVGFESDFASRFVEILKDGVDTAKGVTDAMQRMSESIAALSNNMATASGESSGFGTILGSLSSTLSNIAGPVGIAAGAFQTLWAVGNAINDAFSDTGDIIENSLEESLNTLNQRFMEEAQIRRQYGGDMVAMEEDYRRQQLDILEQHGIDVLNITERQHDRLTRLLRGYNINVLALQRQAELDRARAESEGARDGEATLSDRLASVNAFYERQINLVRQAGGNIAQVETEQSRARLAAIESFGIALFDEQGDGYSRARELARQYGIELVEIEQWQQDKLHEIRQQYISDYDIEQERRNKELKRLETLFVEIQNRYAKQLQYYRAMGYESASIQEEVSEEILAILKSNGVAVETFYEAQYQDIIALAQQYGLKMSDLGQAQLDDQLRMQEDYWDSRHEIVTAGIVDEAQTLYKQYSAQKMQLQKYHINTAKLYREHWDAVKGIIEDANIDVLSLTEKQQDEVYGLLIQAGLKQEDLAKMQEERLLKLRDQYNGKRQTQVEEEMLAEQNIQREREKALTETILQTTASQLDIYAAAENDRIDIIRNTKLEEAAKERADRLEAVEEGHVKRIIEKGNTVYLTREETERRYREKAAQIQKAAYQDRIDSLDAVNARLIKMEKERGQQIIDILAETNKQEKIVNDQLAVSLYELQTAYDAVASSIFHNELVTYDLIEAYSEAVKASQALGDELAGHSLTTAYDAVTDSINNTAIAQSGFNNLMDQTVKQFNNANKGLTKYKQLVATQQTQPLPQFGGLNNAVVGTRTTTNNRSAAPVAIIPKGTEMVQNGVMGGGDVVIQIDNYYGDEAGKQALSDEMTRLMRKRGTI